MWYVNNTGSIFYKSFKVFWNIKIKSAAISTASKLSFSTTFCMETCICSKCSWQLPNIWRSAVKFEKQTNISLDSMKKAKIQN